MQCGIVSACPCASAAMLRHCPLQFLRPTLCALNCLDGDDLPWLELLS